MIPKRVHDRLQAIIIGLAEESYAMPLLGYIKGNLDTTFDPKRIDVKEQAATLQAEHLKWSGHFTLLVNSPRISRFSVDSR
jgi:hypothetical protein